MIVNFNIGIIKFEIFKSLKKKYKFVLCIYNSYDFSSNKKHFNKNQIE